MNARLRSVLHLSAGLACLPGLAQAQADGLKHDPFVRPMLAARPASASPANAVNALLPELAWKPELAAVMLAGPKSAVSIDGTMVRIGEEINGHRLVEVHEQTAVFVKHGKKVTLSLRSLQRVPEPPPARKDESATPARPGAPPKQDSPPKSDDRATADRRDERKPDEK